MTLETTLRLVALAIASALAVALVYDATRIWRSRKARGTILAVALLAGLATVATAAGFNLAWERARAQARAELQTTLKALERAVAANDVEGALAFVSENATQTRALVARNRGAVKIKDAKLSELKVIELDLNRTPPSATVAFHLSVKGTASAWPTPIRLPYRLELELEGVEFRRENDGVWRLQDRYAVKSTAL